MRNLFKSLKESRSYEKDLYKFHSSLYSRDAPFKSGDVYQYSPQSFWLETGKLVTKLAQAVVEFNNNLQSIDAYGPKGRYEIHDFPLKNGTVPIDKFKNALLVYATRADALHISGTYLGINIQFINNHVELLCRGEKSIAPPSKEWPNEYGGNDFRESIIHNLNKRSASYSRFGVRHELGPPFPLTVPPTRDPDSEEILQSENNGDTIFLQRSQTVPAGIVVQYLNPDQTGRKVCVYSRREADRIRMRRNERIDELIKDISVANGRDGLGHASGLRRALHKA